jgi:hypothetical protein
MSKLKYILQTYDKNGKPTPTRDPFYIEEDVSYRTVMLQLIDELRDYNFEIPANDIRIVIGNGKNPAEVYVTLGKE